MKNSMFFPRITGLLLARWTQRNRRLLAGACLLAGFSFFPCWAYGGGSYGGMTGWDGSYGGGTGGDGLPTEEDCRGCHDDLARFPMLEASNVNKHHLLVGEPVVLPTAPPGVEPGETYDCLFCHPAVWDPAIPGYTVSLFRDCLACHAVETVSGPPQMHGTNRHHQLGYQCSVCHEQRR